ILQVSGLMDFFETVVFTQSAVLISMVISVFLIIIDVAKYKNKQAANFLKVIMFVILFAIIEIVNFINNDFNNTSSFMSLAVGFMIVIFFIYYITQVMKMNKSVYRAEFYEQLAYMDYVTQGNNRLAFERDL